MAAVVALIAPAARAATAPVPNNFTWSGTDSAAGVNDKWSDPGNWQGGAAPTQGEPVNPVFPPLHCTATGPCGNARARAFYDRRGFRPTGRSRPFPGAAGRSITEMRLDPAPWQWGPAGPAAAPLLARFIPGPCWPAGRR